MKSYGRLIVPAFVWIIALSLISPRSTPPIRSVFDILNNPESALSDLFGSILGMRRLAADYNWIHLLQYYGTDEEGVTEGIAENGGGHYPKFFRLTMKVVAMDPRMTYAYLYGGAALGWNLNRIPEAEALLKEGVQLNPKEWRLPQYLAALAYQKKHDDIALAQFLENFVVDPETPTVLRELLANLYEKMGRFNDSCRIWEMVLINGNLGERETARRHLLRLLAHAVPIRNR